MGEHSRNSSPAASYRKDVAAWLSPLQHLPMQVMHLLGRQGTRASLLLPRKGVTSKLNGPLRQAPAQLRHLLTNPKAPQLSPLRPAVMRAVRLLSYQGMVPLLTAGGLLLAVGFFCTILHVPGTVPELVMGALFTGVGAGLWFRSVAPPHLTFGPSDRDPHLTAPACVTDGCEICLPSGTETVEAGTVSQ